MLAFTSPPRAEPARRQRAEREGDFDARNRERRRDHPRIQHGAGKVDVLSPARLRVQVVGFPLSRHQRFREGVQVGLCPRVGALVAIAPILHEPFERRPAIERALRFGEGDDGRIRRLAADIRIALQ